MSLKVGVVGMRGIGTNHAGCHREDDLAELVAVCDVIKERADEGGKKFGVKAYYRLQDMLAALPDLDVVDVCTGGYENGSWHFEPTMEALEAAPELQALTAAEEAQRRVLSSSKRAFWLPSFALQADIEEVARRTVQTLKRTVPAAVPGIVFLSGVSPTRRQPCT